jgi:4-hydroxybenzoate polyprenyltransferase
MRAKADVDVYQAAAGAPAALRPPSLAGHLRILRADHWIKNVFALPGIVVALSMDHRALAALHPVTLALGLLALCIVTSSNYVINEVLDAPFDRAHPLKGRRPAACGEVLIPLAYVQWLALLAAGLALGLAVSRAFAGVLLALWVMGCLYNLPPVRTKDVAYVDVLSEAVNNPLRMLAGWYLTGATVVPPCSLLVSYWMVGSYFMAIKRFAEYREIADPARSAAYRRSFAYYSEERLLISITFYAAHAMLFLGAFIMRYRLELILSFPLVALVMAIYLSLGFKPNSAAQRPEGLYREPVLMTGVAACAALMLLLLFVDVPLVYTIFVPSFRH